jgi:hypothetical protein
MGKQHSGTLASRQATAEATARKHAQQFPAVWSQLKDAYGRIPNPDKEEAPYHADPA